MSGVQSPQRESCETWTSPHFDGTLRGATFAVSDVPLARRGVLDYGGNYLLCHGGYESGQDLQYSTVQAC